MPTDMKKKFTQSIKAFSAGNYLSRPVRTAMAILPALAFSICVHAENWTVNFKDADIEELIRFVAQATGKTFITDPKVKGKIQVISQKPLSTEELYSLFLSILEVQGYTAINNGDVIRVVPLKDARASATPVVKGSKEPRSEVITQVIQLNNITATNLIPVLRPMMPPEAHMAAYAPSNALILSDTAGNIERIRKVIEQIDREASSTTEVIKLKHASAEEIVRLMTQLSQQQTSPQEQQLRRQIIVADKRTNSVLIGGDGLERQRIKSIITRLDAPEEQTGNARVIYLEYAQAKDLATVLNKVVQNIQKTSGKDQATTGANKSDASVEADEDTNSLIITAPADMMQSLLGMISRLDIRRAQVLVEAAIVEITDTNARELGIQWLFKNDDGWYGGSRFNTTIDSTSGSGVINGDLTNPGVNGQFLGVGRIGDDVSFNVIVNALQENRNANILSTPSLMTLDNQEASIIVGQNIPVATGSYTATGSDGGTSNPDNPFTTIERENVGISLKVTPQINEGDALVMQIEQEVSSLEGNASEVDATKVVTNERKINTKILIDNKQTIVLGGLIQNNVQETVQKVPLLGDIPWLGRLFRSNATSIRKTNLMVFLRPTIVRDSKTLSGATAQKYKAIRSEQQKQSSRDNEFLKDQELPILPQWEEEVKQLEELRKQNHKNESIDLRPAAATDSESGKENSTALPQAVQATQAQTKVHADEVDDIFAENESAR
jgi:general secretion pathway protein D